MKDILFFIAGIGLGFAVAKVIQNTEGGKKSLLQNRDACAKQNLITGFKPKHHVF